MLFYLAALTVLAADQTVKYLVHRSLSLGQSIPLLGEAVKLTYVRNTGAAFSLFVGFSSYLAIVGLLVSAAVIYFYYKAPPRRISGLIGLAFLLGGSLGNLVDRVARGYVIDYLDLAVWPVFNLADIMINFGVLLIVYDFFKRENA